MSPSFQDTFTAMVKAHPLNRRKTGGNGRLKKCIGKVSPPPPKKKKKVLEKFKKVFENSPKTFAYLTKIPIDTVPYL